jgi:tetratricopeptide (TPR) repeat protein
MRLRSVLAAVVMLVSPLSGSAQTPAPAQSPTPSAQAYYEFMMARRLESDGDLKGALAALERARSLDPQSSELHAELAGFHARQNEGEPARRSAERALALDPDNVEAHRILGLVFAAWADSGKPVAGETPSSLRQQAITHLTAIRKSPAMATDLGLQLAYGRLLLRAGQTEDAGTVLETLVQQAPYIAEPFALLAEVRTSQGRMDDAAEALGQAAAINPRYYISLGDLYERQGRWSAAADAYGEAVANVRSPSRDLRLRWVTALINSPGAERATRAREVLADLLKSNPDDPRLLYLLSSAARRAGDAKGAEDAARRILKVEPSSVAGLNALAQSLADRYAFREVVDLLTPFSRDAASRGKGRELDAATALAQLGIAHQQLAQYDAAVAVLTSAKALVPEDPTFDVYVIQALISARRFDRAEVAAREALVRAPESPRLLRLRGQALSRSGRDAEAIALLEQANKADARSPQLALGLADAYAAAKRFDDAVRVVQQAETAFGEDDSFTLRLTSLYEEAGRIADAERELRRMLNRDPRDATALNYLGYMLADRELRLSEAQSLIEQAIAIEPDNPAYLDSLGWALFKQGKLTEAAGPLSRAAETLPANSVIQDHYGDLLARQGRWTEAVAAWERALAGDGESIDTGALEKKIRDARQRK